jgi:hypothetical protein
MTTVDSKSVGRFDQKLAVQRLFRSLSRQQAASTSSGPGAAASTTAPVQRAPARCGLKHVHRDLTARACAKFLAPPAPLRAAIPRWGPEISAVLYVLEPPNFLGLRRSTRFGLTCGAEGRKQSKRIGDYPLLQGVGVGDLVLSLSSGLALLSLVVGHQIF